MMHRDQSEHPQLWEEIRELWDGASINPNESPKELRNRIMGIRDAFAHSVSPFS